MLGVAPFCGPKTAAASVNAVVTSQATTNSTPRRASGEPTASTAPRPPSVVAEPPQPMTMRRAPASRAARSSWPTPVVSARTGSSPCGWGSSERPAACDISTTAVGPAGSSPSRMRHSASTGRPRGPATVVVLGSPPSASRRPSPPSDIGTSSAVHPAWRAASAIAAAASAADAVPRNLSGAATRCGTLGKLGDRGVGCFGERSVVGRLKLVISWAGPRRMGGEVLARLYTPQTRLVARVGMSAASPRVRSTCICGDGHSNGHSNSGCIRDSRARVYSRAEPRSRRAYTAARLSGRDRSLKESGGQEWCLVRARGLEPPPPCGDRDLNPARLPIPPRPQRSQEYR